MHRVETAHARGEDGSLGTACNHSISLAQTEKVESIYNGVVGRSASADYTVVGAVIAVFHRYMAAGDIRNHLGDKERVVLRAVCSPWIA